LNTKRKKSKDKGGHISARWHDILRGAEENDIDEMRGAVEDNGVSVNYVDPNTFLSALHKAAARDNIEAVEWLCAQEGIDFRLKDKFGRIPFDLAVKFGHQRAIDFLGPLTFPDILGPDAPSTGTAEVIPFDRDI